MHTSNGVDRSELEVLHEPRLKHSLSSEVKAIVRPHQIRGPPRFRSATRIRVHATRARQPIPGEDRRTQSYPPNLFSAREDDEAMNILGDEPLSPILSDEEVVFQQDHKRVKGRSRSANTYRNVSFQDQKKHSALSALSTSLANEIDVSLRARHAELKRSVQEVISEHNASFTLQYSELKQSIEHAARVFECLPSSSTALQPCQSEGKDDRWSEPRQPSHHQTQQPSSSSQPPLPPKTPPAVLPGALFLSDDANEDEEDNFKHDTSRTKRSAERSATPCARASLKRKVSQAGKFALHESGLDARLVHLLEHLAPGLDPVQMAKLRSTVLWKLTHSTTFQWLSAILIFGYSIFIGISSDQELRSEMAKQKPWVGMFYAEISFNAWFILELMLRLAAERKHFFLGEEWKFNCLDTILVGVTGLGFILDPEEALGSASKLGVARIFRFFRFIRVLRIVRVIRSFQSLRLLAFSIIESFTSLFWCFVVVVVVIYIFAIFILSGVTEYYRAPSEGVDSEELAFYWGGIVIAMVSLFKAISGGMDWEDLLRPLKDIDWLYEPIFVFYTFFMLLGVLNVVVATFVETTAQVARNDKDANVKAELSRVKDYWKNISKFFAMADDDGSGSLTWPEFEAYLGNDQVKAYFQTLELDVSEAHVLFKLLAGDDDEVSIDEFCDGCMRLKGKARSIDVNLLIYQTDKMMDQVADCLEKQRVLSETVAERLGITVAVPPTPSSISPVKMSRRLSISSQRSLEAQQLRHDGHDPQ